MGQCPDRARQAEQPARQRACKAKLGIDDGCCPIDIHRYRLAFALFELCLDRAPDGGKVALHNIAGGSGIHQ